jgi:hypothetical protein
MRSGTGTARGVGHTNTGQNHNANRSGSTRSSVLSNRPTATGNGSATGNRSSAAQKFAGWGSGNVATGVGAGNGSYGFSGWGPGYRRGGYGSGYGSGYGNGGYGSGYGSGYGNGGYGRSNGQYVWIFIPSLGWVMVPIRLLLMLGI